MDRGRKGAGRSGGGRGSGRKVGHSNLDASSKAICSDGERGEEEEENKELKSILAKEETA